MTTDERLLIINDLPPGWVWATLEEVAGIGAEQILPLNYPERQFNYLALENISQATGEIVNFAPRLGTEIKSNKFKFTSEHVLYGKLRPYLRKAVAPDFSGISATDLLPLKPIASSLDRHFLVWWLLSPKILEYVVKRQTGVKMPRLRSRDLKQMPIPLPPLAEQQRIIAKIEALFAQSRRGREALDAVPDLLTKFRQAVLAAAFRGDLTRRNAVDEPASVLLERIRAERRRQWEEDLRAKGKDPSRHEYKEPAPPDTTDLPELPEGWVWTTTEQLAAPEKYAMAIGPFGSNLLAREYQDEGVPLIFVRNIRSGIFIGPDTRYVTPKKAKELHAHRVDPGDILATKMGDPPGDACLYPEDHPPAITTSDGVKWRLSPFLPHKMYFVHAINSSLVREQIIKITQGVAQQKISLKRFKTVVVPLAPLSEQCRIVARIEALFARADILEAQVAATRHRLEQVDQAILARAFRGELVPQDPSDEPASALLERIRRT